MIEAPGWNVKKDETIYKAAGAAHLRKYGQFFENLASNCWQGSSSLEYIIEGPLRLTYEINEDVSILSLAETENKMYSKLLASVAATCREIRLLKAEASEFYDKLFSHGERCADQQSEYKIEALLADLQDLSVYVNRVYTVIHLTVRQLSSLASNKHREIYLAPLIEHLMDLLVILVTLDEVSSSQSSLLERWKLYRAKVKSVVHNSSQLNIAVERIVTYERLLRDLQAQLLSKSLFSRAVEHTMDVAKSAAMSEQLLCYLRLRVTELEVKLAEAAPLDDRWIEATVGLVLVSRLFGSCDRKLLRRLLELNRKLYAAALVADLMWLPQDFLAEHLPREGLAALPQQTGERALAARLSRLPQQLQQLAARAVSWAARVRRLPASGAAGGGFEPLADIEAKRALLLEGPALARQLQEAAALPLGLHALLGKPLSRGTLRQLCRLIELQRALETNFRAHAAAVGLARAQLLQQLAYQLLAGLERARATLAATKRSAGANGRLDALALLGWAARLAPGPPGPERRLLLRCGLALAGQLAATEAALPGPQLPRLLDAYDALAELRWPADYSAALAQQRPLLPAYLAQALEGSSSLGHTAQLLAALEAAAAARRSLAPGERRRLAGEPREALMSAALEPACREIEAGLRLRALSHLRPEAVAGVAMSPLRGGCRDGARVVRVSPGLPVDEAGTRLLRPSRLLEHNLEVGWYNLATVAPSDWRAYRGMRALARHQLRLRTGREQVGAYGPGDEALDALEVVRGIQAFVARHRYDLHSQCFVEATSPGRQLRSLGIRHVAASVRCHGGGIVSTSVNLVYRLLRLKLHSLSQFLFDEHVKSRLARELRHVRSRRAAAASASASAADADPTYPYERAERFQRSIRRLGVTPEGLSCLDQCRLLVTQLGNALGYVRLIRSACLQASSNAVSFLPGVGRAQEGHAPELERGCVELGLSGAARAAAARLERDLDNLVRNFSEGSRYFELLVDVFAEAFRNPETSQHLQQFYAIVPPLTLSFVDAALAAKEKLFKKNSSGAGFADDGFAVGLAYVNALLGQSEQLDSLQWFRTVDDYFAAEMAKATAEAHLEDEKLQQTRALTLDRLKQRRAEFQLLHYSLSGARVFFKRPDTS